MFCNNVTEVFLVLKKKYIKNTPAIRSDYIEVLIFIPIFPFFLLLLLSIPFPYFCLSSPPSPLSPDSPPASPLQPAPPAPVVSTCQHTPRPSPTAHGGFLSPQPHRGTAPGSAVQCCYELDGVGPVDNRPSTDWLHNFVKKEKNYIRHVPCDT